MNHQNVFYLGGNSLKSISQVESLISREVWNGTSYLYFTSYSKNFEGKGTFVVCTYSLHYLCPMYKGTFKPVLSTSKHIFEKLSLKSSFSQSSKIKNKIFSVQSVQSWPKSTFNYPDSQFVQTNLPRRYFF